MPKGKIDYSNCYIYKLCCSDINIKKIYVGSTTNLRTRKYNHKAKCNNEKSVEYNYYVYQFIRENGGIENWDMVLLEKYNAVDKLHLLKQEHMWIDDLKPELNTNKPHRTNEEKKEYELEYCKTYKKNKIKCDCGGEYTECDKSRHIKSNKHKYFIETGKIQDFKLKITHCECGGRYKTNTDKKYHIQTDRHKRFVDTGVKDTEHTQCECGGKYYFVARKHHFETKKHKKYIEMKNMTR